MGCVPLYMLHEISMNVSHAYHPHLIGDGNCLESYVSVAYV